MKLGAVEQFTENERNLFFENTGSVILDARLVPIVPGCFDMHPDLRKNPRLLTSIKRIVDRLLNRGQ